MKVQSSQVVMGFQPLKSNSNMTKSLMMGLPSQHIEVCSSQFSRLSIERFTSAEKSSMLLNLPYKVDDSLFCWKLLSSKAVVSFSNG